ncbi:unnamed protein product [Nyctereutes procyonoides]|uniref:(raccoon dog) hypothetical protein n=1 Tax=Nyctereutes procyonoides TaxID=34880 RepID=A0A811ZVP3_NYCPR|nr:unnamed protein product [Nyctereutes procyonoides]
MLQYPQKVCHRSAKLNHETSELLCGDRTQGPSGGHGPPPPQPPSGCASSWTLCLQKHITCFSWTPRLLSGPVLTTHGSVPLEPS